MKIIARVHLIVGIITIAVFLFTGMYMRTHFPEIYQTNESIRYLYRANHIYLLFSGLLNVALGLYFALHQVGWRKRLQSIGSLLFLIAPVLLTWAFFTEPIQASPMRPLTALGVFASVIGILLHLIPHSVRQKL
ncbi:MAG: hypothetical protein HY707_12720 [Ignavibacteriae bacterium]|nr:hypothetical protein [Ignavibacteriota bacterium]